jgi:hypothetical protein
VNAVEITFSGPFAWLPGQTVECLSSAAAGASQGVYIWTMPTPGGELVYYVGETRRTFARRMEEHLSEQLSGRYRLYEPSAFARGEKQLLWRGVYGPGSERNLAGFVQQLSTLAPALVRFVNEMRFHVAPTTCSDRVRRRIEAAISHHHRSQSGVVGAFQDEDVRYAPRRPDEEPVRVHTEWQHPPLGVPTLLEA